MVGSRVLIDSLIDLAGMKMRVIQVRGNWKGFRCEVLRTGRLMKMVRGSKLRQAARPVSETRRAREKPEAVVYDSVLLAG